MKLPKKLSYLHQWYWGLPSIKENLKEKEKDGIILSKSFSLHVIMNQYIRLSKIVWFIYVHVMAFSEVMMGIQKPWNHEITNSGHGCRLWNNYSRLEKLREIRNHHWDASWGAWDLFPVSPPFLDPLRCASMLDNLRYFVFKIICTSEVSTTKQWLRDRCNICLSRSVIRW